MPDNKIKPDIRPQRLCSEIQLFDLCELDSCRHKDGRFCTDSELLEQFEKIAEAETKIPERYLDDELDEESDGLDGDDYDYEDDEFDREDLDDGEYDDRDED